MTAVPAWAVEWVRLAGRAAKQESLLAAILAKLPV